MKIVQALRVPLWPLLIVVGFASGGEASGLEQASQFDLKYLVRQAVDQHPQIMASKASVDRAGADVESARWQFYPVPSLGAERLHGKNQTSFSLRQPIWTGGRLTSDLAVANARRDVALMSVGEVQHELASRVASAWAGVMSATEQLDAIRWGIVELKELEAMMERRQRSGLSAEAELDLLRSRLAQARSDLSAVEAELQIGMEQLSQLTGEPLKVQQLVRLAVKEEHLDVAQSEVAMCATNFSPVLGKLAAEMDAADAHVKQARVQAMPTVFVRYDYQQGQIDGAREPGGRVVFGVEQSFGAGLSFFSGVRSAESGREVASEAYQAARRDVTAQAVADAQGYMAAWRRAQEGAENLIGVERVSESYHRMFLAGKRGWLDLLNMIRERTDVARSLAIARSSAAYYAFRIKLQCGEIL
ncbi:MULTISPECIES: TolC family protein [unclassified Pseudomonas]|uniref:TolC family protein n=1 Tax=unclassified Pseudomonas TaxID=196821 RepID=UPI001314347C|nr:MULTISPECIES: TolC family protein [unclassified Pseudomonas]